MPLTPSRLRTPSEAGVLGEVLNILICTWPLLCTYLDRFAVKQRETHPDPNPDPKKDPDPQPTLPKGHAAAVHSLEFPSQGVTGDGRHPQATPRLPPDHPQAPMHSLESVLSYPKINAASLHFAFFPQACRGIPIAAWAQPARLAQ